MKLENQVVSLELAKKLKELGVKQESLFWWVEKEEGQMLEYEPSIVCERDCSAYTVAELGEILPVSFSSWREDVDRYICEDEIDLIGDYEAGGIWHSKEAKTEADSRAKMIIYLLENKLINGNLQ